MGGGLTGCAAAFRLAKSARMANGRLIMWAAEDGGGGGRQLDGLRFGLSPR